MARRTVNVARELRRARRRRVRARDNQALPGARAAHAIDWDHEWSLLAERLGLDDTRKE